MKTGLAVSVIVALLFGFSNVVAVETQPAQARAARISDAAGVLLKLQKGEVTEEVILAYIENAKRNFDLSAEEIVYLKENGVPDKIVTAALNHRAKFPQIANAPAPPQQAVVAPAQPQQTIVVAPPQTTYVQAAPAPVYVYSAPAYSYYYDPFPYYRYSYYPYRYYGYRYPSFSVNFGLGHGYYGGYRNYGHYGGYGHWGGVHHVGYGGHWGGRRH